MRFEPSTYGLHAAYCATDSHLKRLQHLFNLQFVQSLNGDVYKNRVCLTTFRWREQHKKKESHKWRIFRQRFIGHFLFYFQYIPHDHFS